MHKTPHKPGVQRSKSPILRPKSGVVEYYGYRDYDAQTGRWTARDPIAEQGGLNLYGMVGNDAIGKIDVLGNNLLPLYQGLWFVAKAIIGVVDPVLPVDNLPVELCIKGSAKISSLKVTIITGVQEFVIQDPKSTIKDFFQKELINFAEGKIAALTDDRKMQVKGTLSKFVADKNKFVKYFGLSAEVFSSAGFIIRGTKMKAEFSCCKCDKTWSDNLSEERDGSNIFLNMRDPTFGEDYANHYVNLSFDMAELISNKCKDLIKEEEKQKSK